MSAGQRGHELVNGDRENDYGPPSKNFQVIADLWSAYMGVPVSKADAVNLMILLKVARLRTGGPHHDSIVDIAGYASVHERLDEA